MDTEKSIKSFIISYLDGDIEPLEQEKLLIWISESDENSRYFTQIKDLWEASLSNISEIVGTEEEWGKLRHRIVPKSKTKTVRFALNSWPRIAAVLIIGVLLGSLIVSQLSNQEPVYFTSIAPLGSISQTILPDGSIVYLNAGSEIRYTLNSIKNREVELSGEAWFSVEKDEDAPFVVHTNSYDVEVLGTQFNVKAYKEEQLVTTTLEEGSVLIRTSENIKLKENIYLKPGEQLTYDRTINKLQKKEVETRLYTSWRENKLIFLDMNFNELIELLQRKYGVEIIISDTEIQNYHYTGTIKDETILEVLNVIQYTYPIQYKINGQKVIISKK